MSRIPEARTALELSPGRLGTLLLAMSAGAVLALPASGALVARFGAAAVVATGAVVTSAGLVLVGSAADLLGSVPLTALGLFAMGLGSGSWDVAMNVEGAVVERGLRRTVMPRFHAAFSLGTVAGAAVGALAAWLGAAVSTHLAGGAVLVALLGVLGGRWFLPAAAPDHATGGRRNPLAAWLEPRTLAIGLLVLALALTEGTANDWLAVALVDGHGVHEAVGAAGFAVFVAAMTLGRTVGTGLLDRFGRLPVLWSSMALAGVGVVVTVFAGSLPLVAVGVVMWGLGASLGFPVGISAAADDPSHAAARVSVVSTIGYTAFLVGPPLLGYLGDHVGVLRALLLVAVLLVPSMLAAPAARPPRPAPQPVGAPPGPGTTPVGGGRPTNLAP
ncbi:MFS transporter [Thalassiella azotivora]